MNRKTKIIAFVAILSFLLLAGVALARTLKIGTQAPVFTDENTQLIQRIRDSEDYPLQIKQAADTPFPILSATVKEISREDYQKLTGKVTDLNTVISVPEAKLQNISNKRIIELFFITRDLSTNKLKGMMMKDISVEPGEFFYIKRGGAVKTDSVTVAKDDGTVRELTKESMTNENYWLPYANKDQLQVSVVVTFADESTWANPDGGNQ